MVTETVPCFFVHAIRIYADAGKNVPVIMLRTCLLKNFSHGNLFEIPEYAYDMHTAKGRGNGKRRKTFPDRGK